MTKLLLEAGAPPNTRDSRSGSTALHLAVKNRHCCVVEMLLEAGADPNQQDASGFTALHTAVVAGLVDAMRLLIQFGAVFTSITHAG